MISSSQVRQRDTQKEKNSHRKIYTERDTDTITAWQRHSEKNRVTERQRDRELENKKWTEKQKR